MRQGVQSFFLSAGRNGCYCFCIIELAERILGQPIDAYTALCGGIEKGFIRVDKNNYANPNNFFVKMPDAFLKYLCGKNYGVKKTSANYKPKEGELVVECWELRKINHFKLPDWDSLEISQVVKHGEIVSFRVFYPL